MPYIHTIWNLNIIDQQDLLMFEHFMVLIIFYMLKINELRTTIKNNVE